MKPLAIDLYCGLGGWTDGLLAEGYDVVGFDVEQHVYGDHRYPAQLVVQDVLTLHGSQFKSAALIVASPPCQAYSFMAMPWRIGKARAAAIRADETGAELERLNALFNACFRIQREACEAAGHHIPLIVENVRGAQPWVGRSRWAHGSFHLWGDVPALMPIASRAVKVGMDSWRHPSDPRHVPGLGFNTHADRNCREATKVAGFRFDGSGASFQTAAVKVASLDGGRRTDPGKGAKFTTRDCGLEAEGVKQRGSGREWFAGDGKISRMTSSKSPARKMASAMIAKIPLGLSMHIARMFYPREKMEEGVPINTRAAPAASQETGSVLVQ
jgi:hypothetical protein